jgi:hypothetical protein
MDSLVLQTAIGLVFVFAVFAALVSVLTELIARFIGLRGEYLLRGIRSLVDGKSHFELRFRDLLRRQPPADAGGRPPAMVTRIMTHPLIEVNADKAQMPDYAGNTKLTSKQRRKLPSYLSGRSFTRALIDLVVPDGTGQTTIDDLKEKIAAADVPDELKKRLLNLATSAGNDVASFRRAVEEWYDDHMARVSGWYKRHVRWISLALAAVLVVAFNISAVAITRSLYTDQALRGSVVTEATNAAQCTNKSPADCLSDVRREIEQVRGAGLPIGWGTVPDCLSASPSCGWLAAHGLADPALGGPNDAEFFLLVLLGWTLMVVSLLPGARFWFDLLGRLGTLRSTGPRPADTATAPPAGPVQIQIPVGIMHNGQPGAGAGEGVVPTTG